MVEDPLLLAALAGLLPAAAGEMERSGRAARTLSGGEARRVHLARVLALGAEVSLRLTGGVRFPR